MCNWFLLWFIIDWDLHILSGIFRQGECLYCVLMVLFEIAELINFFWQSMLVWYFGTFCLKVLFKCLVFLNDFCSGSSSLRCIWALLGRHVSSEAGFCFKAAALHPRMSLSSYPKVLSFPGVNTSFPCVLTGFPTSSEVFLVIQFRHVFLGILVSKWVFPVQSPLLPFAWLQLLMGRSSAGALAVAHRSFKKRDFPSPFKSFLEVQDNTWTAQGKVQPQLFALSRWLCGVGCVLLLTKSGLCKDTNLPLLPFQQFLVLSIAVKIKAKFAHIVLVWLDEVVVSL